jgi:uncharacterized protein DUF4339
MADADSLQRARGTSQGGPAAAWQVNTRGRKVSEMSLTELGMGIKAGKLTARTLVWSDGMSEWTPIGDVPALAKLLRDSVPPPSGTRPRLDELVGGARPYGQAGDATTDTGGIAIYERPIALIEFPKELSDIEDLDGPLEELAEPEDEPTRALIAPARIITAAPRPAAGAPPRARPATPEPKAATPSEPPLPPLPPMRSVQATLPFFPAPVMASPLAAALSSTTAGPAAEPSPALATAATTTAVPATAIQAPITAAPTTDEPAPESDATPTVRLPRSDASAAESDVTATVKPPRPAIEFLPPIIVQEKDDDDGTSAILELPLHSTRDASFTLREAPVSESTLVLSGRRRARRWVPLNAAIALGVGAACLASALTAVTIRNRSAAPRIVERIVTVPAAPAPAPASTAEATASEVVPPATTTLEPQPTPDKAKPTERTAAAERATKSDEARAEPNKSDASKSDATKLDGTKADTVDPSKADASAAARSHEASRPDPAPLDAADAKPNLARREARAGFPTNPGF